MSNRDEMLGALMKLAEKKGFSKRFNEAEPWAVRAVKSAVPTAIAANYLIPMADSVGKKRTVAAITALGAGLGLADLAADKRASKMRKVAALAGDLRRLGIGGVKRPPFPTQGSLAIPTQNLKKSQNLGKFWGSTKPKDLIKPGPSIAQVSTEP